MFCLASVFWDYLFLLCYLDSFKNIALSHFFTLTIKTLFSLFFFFYQSLTFPRLSIIGIDRQSVPSCGSKREEGGVGSAHPAASVSQLQRPLSPRGPPLWGRRAVFVLKCCVTCPVLVPCLGSSGRVTLSTAEGKRTPSWRRDWQLMPQVVTAVNSGTNRLVRMWVSEWVCLITKMMNRNQLTGYCEHRVSCLLCATVRGVAGPNKWQVPLSSLYLGGAGLVTWLGLHWCRGKLFFYLLTMKYIHRYSGFLKRNLIKIVSSFYNSK